VCILAPSEGLALSEMMLPKFGFASTFTKAPAFPAVAVEITYSRHPG